MAVPVKCVTKNGRKHLAVDIEKLKLIFGWIGSAVDPKDLTEAAKGLGVSRKTLSAILNGRAGISPEMAVRPSLGFGTSSESWLNQQIQFDLWLAEKGRKNLRVLRLAA